MNLANMENGFSIKSNEEAKETEEKEEREDLYPATFKTKQVKEVQSFLNDEGISDQHGEKLIEDGRYGAKTANAVMKFQRENGLIVDGIVGKETWKAIDEKKEKKEKGEQNSLSNLSAPYGVNKGSNSITDLKPNLTSADLTKNTFKDKSILPDKNILVNKNAFDKERLTSYGDRLTQNNNEKGYETFSVKPTLYKNSVKEETGLNFPIQKTFMDDFKETVIEANATPKTDEYSDEYLGVKRSGYNSKGEWSDDLDKDEYGENSQTYKLLTICYEADEIAAKNGDRNARIALKTTADNLRDFDTESFTKAYYMLNSKGAGIFGHAGVLLVNEDGEGILFSYYRHNDADGYFGIRPDLRIGVFDKNATDKMINGGTIKTSSVTGDFCTEIYDKSIGYNIKSIQGKMMLEEGIRVASDMPDYDLLSQNCDDIATQILKKGKLIPDIEGFIPNTTFDKLIDEAYSNLN